MRAAGDTGVCTYRHTENRAGGLLSLDVTTVADSNCHAIVLPHKSVLSGSLCVRRCLFASLLMCRSLLLCMFSPLSRCLFFFCQYELKDESAVGFLFNCLAITPVG